MRNCLNVMVATEYSTKQLIPEVTEEEVSQTKLGSSDHMVSICR